MMDSISDIIPYPVLCMEKDTFLEFCEKFFCKQQSCYERIQNEIFESSCCQQSLYKVIFIHVFKMFFVCLNDKAAIMLSLDRPT